MQHAHQNKESMDQGISKEIKEILVNRQACGTQEPKACQALGIACEYDIGLVRNHYVGRTFISPNQNARELKVRCKFNTVRRVVENKIVVLLDDSIVRGTTSKQLIK